jgi:hypothetical protein
LIRIAITEVAFEAIADTLPLGSVGYEDEPNEKGERLIWVERNRQRPALGPARPGESYSDVILRLVEIEARS